jgi:anti-sigma regulatory factor (Ser/Thr protein kinase)
MEVGWLAKLVTHQSLIAVADRSMIGETRRVASQTAGRLGLEEEDRSRVSIVASELATNLLHYAKGGELLIRSVDSPSGAGIEIIAFDRGPGMDLQRCMVDGYSTGGTKGCGLGAVQRLSSEFDVYSSPKTGSVVLSRIQAKTRKVRSKGPGIRFSVISVPAPHENECGDGWSIAAREDAISVVVADGLGHGTLAAVAANRALACFGSNPFVGPCEYLEAAHTALHSTRGAAVAFAAIDPQKRNLRYAGVGNIAGVIEGAAGEKRQPLLSHNGTLGAQIRKLQQFDLQWNAGDLLIMHSDGLSERWSLGQYPGLFRCDLALIAAALYRDCRRGRDDATILVVRL